MAVSKESLPDYIFEIKYNVSGSVYSWNSFFGRMRQQESVYLRETGRKVILVLVIVTQRDYVKRIQTMAERYLRDLSLIVKVISEDEIGMESN